MRGKLEEYAVKAQEHLRSVREQQVIGRWVEDKTGFEYLQKCVVGDVSKMEHIEEVQAILKSASLEGGEIKLIGRRNILTNFGSAEAVTKVIDNKVHGIHFWVKKS